MVVVSPHGLPQVVATLCVMVGLVMLATTTGMTAAMIGTQAMLVQQDSRGQVLLTGKATYDLPLYVAPVIDVQELFNVKKIRATVPHPEVSHNVITSFHITRVTKVNSTAIVFYALGGAQIRVWNGITTVRFSANGPDIPVCSANVTCAAFQVDSSTLVEKYVAEAEASLTQFSEGRRQLAEACVDPLSVAQRTVMQTAATDKCSAQCENTCPWSSDGVCTDGGNGSINAGKHDPFYCFYGTDCADCGARPGMETGCLLLSNQAKFGAKADALASCQHSPSPGSLPPSVPPSPSPPPPSPPPPSPSPPPPSPSPPPPSPSPPPPSPSPPPPSPPPSPPSPSPPPPSPSPPPPSPSPPPPSPSLTATVTVATP